MDIEALRPDQWMNVDFACWEGAVRVRGLGAENSSVGYLELTCYPLH
jgi:predicted secreted hydrolase